MLIDTIVALSGLVLPPVFDFIKKKFIKTSKDTPEVTIATLAVTKPEVLAEYVKAQSVLIYAQVAYYNRDVTGDMYKWVGALRACIRPAVVVVGLLHLFIDRYFPTQIPMDAGTRYFYIVNISSWFGTKMNKE